MTPKSEMGRCSVIDGERARGVQVHPGAQKIVTFSGLDTGELTMFLRLELHL